MHGPLEKEVKPLGQTLVELQSRVQRKPGSIAEVVELNADVDTFEDRLTKDESEAQREEEKLNALEKTLDVHEKQLEMEKRMDDELKRKAADMRIKQKLKDLEG